MTVHLQPQTWVRVGTADMAGASDHGSAWPASTGHKERDEMLGARGEAADREGDFGNEKRPRKDKGRRLLTERDRTVLAWTTEQYAVRLDQLQRLLGRDPQRPLETDGELSLSGARHVVGRWEEGGYAESEKVFFREPSWVWPSRRGLQRLQLDYPYHRPALAKLPHYYWVNETRLYLEGPNYLDPVQWRSERALVPQEARSAAIHYVDAEVEIGEVTVAIEVELTRKKPADLRTILEDLVARYEEVWYFTLADSRVGVERAVAGLPSEARDRVQVLKLENLS